MKILLKSLKLKDFYSHESTTINFDENVKLLLDGESGAGKSTILESIIFALYGESRTDNKSIVRSRCKKATVILGLVNTEAGVGQPHEIVIERSITSGGKHSLSVLLDGIANPLTGVKDLQNYIEKDLIGASYLLFVNSVAYMQGNAESFVSQTAARRKELLLEIVKAENYDEYYEKAKDVLSTIIIQKSALETQVTTLKHEISVAEEMKNEEVGLNAELIRTKTHIASLEMQKDELLKFIAKHEESEKNIKLCENRVTAAEQDVNRAKDALESLRNQLKDLNTLTLDRNIYDALRAEIGTKQALLDVSEATLSIALGKERERNAYLLTRPHIIDMSIEIPSIERHIENLKNRSSCPSGEACPHQKGIIADIESGKKKIAEINRSMIDDALKLSVWEEKLKDYPEIAEVDNLSVSIKKIRDELSGMTQRLSEMDKVCVKIESLKLVSDQLPFMETSFKDKITVRDAAVNELDLMKKMSSSVGLTDSRNKLDQLGAELMARRAEESSIGSQLKLIQQAKDMVTEKSAVLSNIETNLLPDLIRNYDNVQLVKEAFGSKGIKSVIIDYLLPKLEDKINLVLSQLSDFTVRLDTQQLKSDGEGNKEGLFITIMPPNGLELPFEALSGGEKVKITVAISEALASLQRCGFRLFDEFVTALDDDSLENFMVTIEQLQTKYNQMVVISHIQSIKDMFETKILCSKKNNTTTIV